MVKSLFRREILFSLVVLILVALPMTPALAQGQDRDDLVCTGDNLTLRAGETARNLLAFGCNIRIENGATVENDVSVFGGNATVSGTVNGSIVVFGGNVLITSSGVVNGNVSAIGGNIMQETGAIVRGSINRGFGPRSPFRTILPVLPILPLAPLARDFFEWGFNLIGSMITAIAFATLGALIVLFAPDPTRRVGQAVETRPLETAGVGCLTLIVLPVLVLLFTITIIGIPVALLLLFGAILVGIFGWSAIGLLTGEKILQALKQHEILPVVAVIIGVIVLMVVGQVPLIGWLISLLIVVLGMGAVVLTRFGTRAYPTPPAMTRVPTVGVPGAPPPPPSATPTAAAAHPPDEPKAD